MTSYQPPQFNNNGDWLIWRSEGILGDFRLSTCISIIGNENAKGGLYLSSSDISRILARYKEHVNFWNVGIDVIRSELNSFANAVGRSFIEIATTFDSLPTQRMPKEERDSL